MDTHHIAAVRSTICSCCQRRGARYMVRLDLHGRDLIAVCPACDAQATEEPGWTEHEEHDPRR